MIQLGEICTKSSSSIAQKDLENCDGVYPIYGASGLIKYVDFYQQENPYIAVVKDGAGVGRVMRLPAKSSVIGTMQYIIPNEGINVHYLAYAMEYMNLAKYYTGATIPHIYFKDYCKESLQAHNLDEQCHIALMLDKIVSLISLRKQQLAKLDELVKARFVEMFEGIPETEYITLKDICSIITDGTHQPPKFVESGIPFLFVSNIVGNVITYQAEKFITEGTYAELIKRTPIEVGDILLSTVGSYGHPAIVKSSKRFCFQRHIAYLKPNGELVDSAYLHGALLSENVQRQIEERVKGIAQKTLNLSEIKEIQIPLPSLEMQKRFTVFSNNIDDVRLTIQQSLDKLEVLKKSLMQGYFG